MEMSNSYRYVKNQGEMFRDIS